MSTENTIAKLAYIEETKLAIKQAIIDKGVSIELSDTFRSYAAKIGEIQISVPETVDYLVRFIDYDGTVLKEETVNIGDDATAPALPTHANLTFQQWNNGFTNVTRDIDVGASYITTDGKTHIFITLTTPTGLSPTLYLQKFTAGLMTINWGDGNSETDSSNGNIAKAHTYSATGNYVITIQCAGGYTLGDSTTKCIVFSYEYCLTKVLVGGNVTTIIEDAFENCNSLQNISLPVGVTSLAIYAFYTCTSLRAIVLPIGLLTIASYAFSNNHSIQNIVLPVGLTSIGSNAISYCYTLESIILPISLTSIGLNAFQFCYSLQNIVIPIGITTIQNNLFASCLSLTTIVLPVNLTSIGNGAFSACYSLQNINFPVGVTSIGSSAFNFCYSLKNVVLPFGLISIGNTAFSSCYSLENIELPDSLTTIGNDVFSNCYALENIEFPEGCVIGTDLLERCYVLTTLTIPEGNTTIGNDFALECKSLKTAYLPSTITSIADDAFSLCQQLNTLDILATTPPTLNAGAFDTYSKILKIYVPDASVEAYKAATNWLTLANYIHPISSKP